MNDSADARLAAIEQRLTRIEARMASWEGVLSLGRWLGPILVALAVGLAGRFA